MNRHEVIGNLTKDAEVKSVNSKKVINFSIAYNQVYKDSNGERLEKTTFYNCSIWRDENVKIADYLTKGTKVYVSGLPEPESWYDKNNNLQLGLKITVNNIEILGGGVKKANPEGNDFPA